MDSNLIPYQPVISDIKNLIAAGQNVAYNAANRAMIMTYWNIGKRIVEEEQSGAERAEYGKRLISILSDELTKEFGSNYSGRSLRYYRKFYLCFPDFEIWNTRVPNLKVGKAQIKFSVVSETSTRIIASKLFRKFIRQNRNQPFAILCTLGTALFLFNNALSNVPVGHNHCAVSCIIGNILACGNQIFNIGDYRLIRNEVAVHLKNLLSN